MKAPRPLTLTRVSSAPSSDCSARTCSFVSQAPTQCRAASTKRPCEARRRPWDEGGPEDGKCLGECLGGV